jgi:hypothetical protein
METINQNPLFERTRNAIYNEELLNEIKDFLIENDIKVKHISAIQTDKGTINIHVITRNTLYKDSISKIIEHPKFAYLEGFETSMGITFKHFSFENEQSHE